MTSATEDAIARTLLMMLSPQLELLGFRLGEVPGEGCFFSKRSRGYILGMTSAMLTHLNAAGDPKTCQDAIQAAFSLVFRKGDDASAFFATMKEAAASDPEVLAGAHRAERDVNEVYAGEPHAAVVGFWLLNNGLNDPGELMPV